MGSKRLYRPLSIMSRVKRTAFQSAIPMDSPTCRPFFHRHTMQKPETTTLGLLLIGFLLAPELPALRVEIHFSVEAGSYGPGLRKG